MKLMPGRYKLIILSILIALLLWFYVNNQNDDFSIFISDIKNDMKETFLLELEMKNLADDYKIEDLSNDKVVVQLEEMTVFSNYKKEDFSAYIDLTGIEEGKNTRLVKVKMPTNVKIKAIDPEYVQIKARKK